MNEFLRRESQAEIAMRENRYREGTIPINEAEIKKYLDGAIQWWRAAKERGDEIALEPTTVGESAIDVFQSVRISLFGELLP